MRACRRAEWPQAALNWTNLLLVAIGIATLLLYDYGLRLQRSGSDMIFDAIKLMLGQGMLYLIGAWLVWRARASRSTFLIVIIFAVAFRLSLLFAPPYLSDDIYRYVWDGRVQAAGINPYKYIPADESLAPLRDASIYPHINRRDFAHTIYPPLAQSIFFLTTRVSESVTWMKATMLGFEAIGLCALLALLASFKLPAQRVLLAAWHPLLVWEIAGSGHLDAIMIASILLALLARRQRRDSLTGAALACAVLVKFFPAILFPALYRRWDWRMPMAFVATIVLFYVPYLSVGIFNVLGYLPGYASEEGLQSGERFFILSLARKVSGAEHIPNAAFAAVTLIILFALAIWSLWRQATESGYATSAFVLAMTFTALLSPRYAWYFAWLVPLLCFAPSVLRAPTLYLTLAGFALYRLWIYDKPHDVFVLNVSLYLPFTIILVGMLWRSRVGAWRSVRRADGERVSP